MYLINGINHLRCVGIWNADGQAEDFDPENSGGYRSPQTAEERRACVAKALEYYNECSEKCEFGITPITPEQAAKLGDLSADISLFAMEFEDWLNRHRHQCRYCGANFISEVPWADVCKNPECQRQRKNEKARNYHRRKTNNPA